MAKKPKVVVKVKRKRKPKKPIVIQRLKVKRVEPFTRIRMDMDEGIRFVWYEVSPGFPKTTKTTIVKGLVFFTFWDSGAEAYRIVEASTGFTCGKGDTRTMAVWDCSNGISATGVPEFREMIAAKQAEHARLIWKEDEENN